LGGDGETDSDDDEKGVLTVIRKRFRLRFLFRTRAGYDDDIGAIVVVFNMLVVINEHVILAELWSEKRVSVKELKSSQA
jgi:hypothetical protein